MDRTAGVLIYTIGYGNRKMRDFLDLLKGLEIQYLIDIRSKPISRFHADFRKDRLKEHLQTEGILYSFMGKGLGGVPDDLSLYTEGRADYWKIRESLPFKSDVARLQTAVSQNLRLMLMCACSKPEVCHRVKLVGAVLEANGIPARHIDEQGHLLTFTEVKARLTGGHSLFEDESILRFSSKVLLQ